MFKNTKGVAVGTSQNSLLPAIVVVDDSDDDLLFLQRALLRLEVINPVIRFDQAEEALSYLTAQDLNPSRVGLLLLDINLPGLDGVDLLKQLNAHDPLLFVPAVMFTSTAAPEDIKRSYLAGANAFVTKPLAAADFTQAIKCITTFWLHAARLPAACFEVC